MKRPPSWLQVVVAILCVGATAAGCGGSDQATEKADPARPTDWPSAVQDPSPTPLGTPPTVPSGQGQFEFVATQADGSAPVAWDPCRPIHYVVNPTGGPPNQAALIQDAVARTSAATGLQFVDDGTTDETWTAKRERFQPDRYGDRWAPVLISWADESTVPVLAGPVAGQGGPSGVRPPGDDRFVHVSGSIVLDSSLGATAAMPQGAESVRALIQHELGHVVGLDHVASPTELMFTESVPEQSQDWGPGDREGLALLGRGDCFPDV